MSLLLKKERVAKCLMSCRIDFYIFIFYILEIWLTIDPHAEPQEVQEPLPFHGIPAQVRVALLDQLRVALKAAAGQVHGYLLQVRLAQSQGQLVVVHQRGVGHIQRAGSSQ